MKVSFRSQFMRFTKALFMRIFFKSLLKQEFLILFRVIIFNNNSPNQKGLNSEQIYFLYTGVFNHWLFFQCNHSRKLLSVFP